ncbi:hypothetical protein EV385_6124 [Krasilnikovia cinnamomea]|uniref:Fibronectin type-III domain-containing protein n=1 Tax=Krasilnikovia cinnamomea TaxID=349313 RepID=A0A4Q7ZTI2_9ACTN|nr:fibronectin type III domain-containing protein [Krasilnikovia cinnamomea]RZU54181.1 hypothetical protein EV385_6124 [Krasilnikovia cinnamomea]
MDWSQRRRAAALGAVTAVAVAATLGAGGGGPAAAAAPASHDKASRHQAAAVTILNGFQTHLRAAFAESTIRDHASSGLTLTVQRDPNVTASDLTGIGFTIDLPEHLVVASSDVANDCAGTVNPNPGDAQLVVSGIDLAAADPQCTVGIAVTSAHSGSYTIDNSAVTSTAGQIGAGITPDTLVVTTAPPTLSGYFQPGDITVGDTSTLTFYLYRADQNPTAVTSGIAWKLSLPAGLAVVASSGNTCGGTVTATAGSRTFTLTGGVIGAGDFNCQAAVQVRGNAGALYELHADTLTQLNHVEAAFGVCIGSTPGGGSGQSAACFPQLQVDKLTQTVTFPQPGPRKVGDSTLSGTASSGLPVTFRSRTTGVCTTKGTTLTVKTEGVCTVAAVQVGNGVYAEAESEDRTIEILPRPPAPPTVSGVAGQSSITVTWTAPDDTSAIDDYQATARSGDIVSSCESTALTCVLGAVAGQAYTLSVVSRGPNGSSRVTTGAGTVTASAPRIPSSPPPTNLILTTTDGRITTAEPGQAITFLGDGFAAFSTVVLTFYSDPTVLGTVVTDASGAFRKSILVPANLAAGAHTAVAQGVAPDGTARAMALDITVQGLPVTGPGVATLLLLATAAILAGGGLLLASRPRRRTTG